MEPKGKIEKNNLVEQKIDSSLSASSLNPIDDLMKKITKYHHKLRILGINEDAVFQEARTVYDDYIHFEEEQLNARNESLQKLPEKMQEEYPEEPSFGYGLMGHYLSGEIEISDGSSEKSEDDTLIGRYILGKDPDLFEKIDEFTIEEMRKKPLKQMEEELSKKAHPHSKTYQHLADIANSLEKRLYAGRNDTIMYNNKELDIPELESIIAKHRDLDVDDFVFITEPRLQGIPLADIIAVSEENTAIDNLLPPHGKRTYKELQEILLKSKETAKKIAIKETKELGMVTYALGEIKKGERMVYVSAPIKPEKIIKENENPSENKPRRPDYCLECANEEQSDIAFIADALEIADQTSMAPHLPSKNELKNVHSKTGEEFAAENLEFEILWAIEDNMVYILPVEIALEKIPPDTPLGINYGPFYWAYYSKRDPSFEPILMNKAGKAVKKEDWELKETRIILDDTYDISFKLKYETINDNDHAPEKVKELLKEIKKAPRFLNEPLKLPTQFGDIQKAIDLYNESRNLLYKKGPHSKKSLETAVKNLKKAIDILPIVPSFYMALDVAYSYLKNNKEPEFSIKNSEYLEKNFKKINIIRKLDELSEEVVFSQSTYPKYPQELRELRKNHDSDEGVFPQKKRKLNDDKTGTGNNTIYLTNDYKHSIQNMGNKPSFKDKPMDDSSGEGKSPQ